MTFDDSLPVILRLEGGYVHDPQDSGGATNKGVTQSVYNDYRKQHSQDERSVLYITNDEVREIYYKNYWLAAQCDKLPPGLGLCVFDFAVNSGVAQASRSLQRVVGTTVDGKIGPLTLKAVSEHEPADLIYGYSQERRRFYEDLVDKRPKDAKFIKGWLLRVSDTQRRAIKLLSRSIEDSAGSGLSKPSSV